MCGGVQDIRERTVWGTGGVVAQHRLGHISCGDARCGGTESAGTQHRCGGRAQVGAQKLWWCMSCGGTEGVGAHGVW